MTPEDLDKETEERRRSPVRRLLAAIGGFIIARLDSLVRSITAASNEEKVRAVLALTLVGLLVALQFWPSGHGDLTIATETLAISVVAFYFGLHSGPSTGVTTTPERSAPTQGPATPTTAVVASRSSVDG